MNLFDSIKKQFEVWEQEVQEEKRKKEEEKLEKEYLEKIKHKNIIKEIREEYIKELPFRALDVIAMRKTSVNEGILFCEEVIEFFRKDGSRCYLSNYDYSKKTDAEFYLTLYKPSDICEALSCVIPRLADGRLLINSNKGYNDLRDKYHWIKLSFDEKYINEFITAKEIYHLNKELYSRLVGVIDAWRYLGESDLNKQLGQYIYKEWIGIINACGKVIDERRRLQKEQLDKEKIEREEKRRVEEKRVKEAEAEKQRKIAEELRAKEDDEVRIKKEKFMAELEARHAEEERREAEKQERIIAAGKKGEEEVEYALKWLDKSYEVLKGKEGKIRIENPEFIDEAQECDHIVVGPVGVVLIETKAYSGRINIDKAGNWTRYKNDEWIGTVNPVQQVRRHEKLIRSFVPNNIPINSYICLANSSVIIEGSENSIIPIVKSDLLVEHIENLEVKKKLTKKEMDECIELIGKHMV